MKRLFTTIFIFFATLSGFAQNLQLHYDFGSALYSKEWDNRPVLTTTVEMFHPDSWGSTFFFIDMDYTGDGISSAYWEIARELQFWKAPVSIHLEYNGGLSNHFSLNNAWLGGATYTYNSADFTKGFTFSTLYKYIQKHSDPHNFQLTLTWYLHFLGEGLLTCSGFADWWREKNPNGDYIFMAEPQLWFNLNKLKRVSDSFKLSVGSEVELIHNFGATEGFYAIPTLAVKWTFD